MHACMGIKPAFGDEREDCSLVPRPSITANTEEGLVNSYVHVE